MESTHASQLTPRGFTLVEMIVVLSIIITITAIVLTGQSQFDNSLRVTDTAYTVALSLRQAQTFGLSSRTYSGTSNAGYGAHFDSTTPKNYTMFADVNKVVYPVVPAYCPVGVAGAPDAKNGNCLYDNVAENVQTYTFGRGFQISRICGHDMGGSIHCTDDTSNPVTVVDIVFLRPNTDTVITAFRAAASSIQLSDASIVLSAPGNTGNRTICVSLAGQVSVASTTCP